MEIKTIPMVPLLLWRGAHQLLRRSQCEGTVLTGSAVWGRKGMAGSIPIMCAPSWYFGHLGPQSLLHYTNYLGLIRYGISMLAITVPCLRLGGVCGQGVLL